MSGFDEFMKTTMLPAECDDDRVIVGMRLAWQEATRVEREACAVLAETIPASATFVWEIPPLIADAIRGRV